MTFRLPHETRAGVFSEPETFLQLIEHLRLAAEACYFIGHHRKENGDELIGQGFLGVGQMLEMTCDNVTHLATKGRVQ